MAVALLGAEPPAALAAALRRSPRRRGAPALHQPPPCPSCFRLTRRNSWPAGARAGSGEPRWSADQLHQGHKSLGSLTDRAGNPRNRKLGAISRLLGADAHGAASRAGRMLGGPGGHGGAAQAVGAEGLHGAGELIQLGRQRGRPGARWETSRLDWREGHPGNQPRGSLRAPAVFLFSVDSNPLRRTETILQGET